MENKRWRRTAGSERSRWDSYGKTRNWSAIQMQIPQTQCQCNADTLRERERECSLFCLEITCFEERWWLHKKHSTYFSITWLLFTIWNIKLEMKPSRRRMRRNEKLIVNCFAWFLRFEFCLKSLLISTLYIVFIGLDFHGRMLPVNNYNVAAVFMPKWIQLFRVCSLQMQCGTHSVPEWKMCVCVR